MKIEMQKKDGACGTAGCSNGSEAVLGGCALCRVNFCDLAAKGLEEHRESLRRSPPAGPRNIAILKFLSEVISASTTLVVRAKMLDARERDRLRELSFSAMELYKRAQRNPRVPLNTPIILYRETGIAGNQELASTVNVSKHGACVETVAASLIGDKIWIQKPATPMRALAKVAWIKKHGPTQFLMGLDLVEDKNFWELGSAPASTIQ